ncbi:MAG: WbqC family protein [Bacteroidota bacterium]
MTSIFPLPFFGSISFYKELVLAKNPVFEQWETFPRHSIRNHCKVLSPNGVLELTVPLSKPFGSKTRTKDVQLDFTTDWKKKHWRTIVSSYASSPFFDYYGMEIQELLDFETNNVVEFNLNIHKRICSWLDLEIDFPLTEDYFFEVEHDFRKSFSFQSTESDYSYQQVFSGKENFISDLSILDAILNLGPMARKILL